MMNRSSALFSLGVSAAFVGAIACSDATTESPAGTAASRLLAQRGPAVATAYATLARDNYAAAQVKVKLLRAAVDAFVSDPTEAKFSACKDAWNAARPLYVQTEAFRFYDGPIEDVEGLINAWPMDENYVDYVKAPETDAGGGSIHPALGYAITSDGIINDAQKAITAEALRAANEADGEANISTGFHAIEFLLWGQDFDAAGPGKRPYTDFVTGASGTALNQDRRRAYLKAVTDMLVEDIDAVIAAWAATGDTYGAKFPTLDPKVSIANMLKGIGSLGGIELANERMNNAYTTKEQEEEHSCFSDTTTVDHINDGIGIENVYYARLEGNTKGASLSELVAELDPALDAKMKSRLEAAMAATRGIPAPFDQAFLGADDAPGRQKIKAAIEAWKAVTETIVEIATAFGLSLNIE